MLHMLGVSIWFIVLTGWYMISTRIPVWIRFLIETVVVVVDVIVNMLFINEWKLILIFGIVISAAFFLAEYFPKTESTRGTVQLRRMKISIWEDYVFFMGVMIMGIEVIILSILWK